MVPQAWRPRRHTAIALAFVAGAVPTMLSTAITLSEESEKPAVWRIVTLAGAQWYFWVLATPVIIRLVRSRAANLKWYAVTGAALIVVHAAVSVAVRVAVYPPLVNESVFQHFTKEVLDWLFMDLVLFVAILAAVRWADAAQRERERELHAAALRAQLAQAQLSALRMQLHPHFLFNALNTITVLVREQDVNTAVSLLTRLGDVMRRILRDDSTDAVPLEDELVTLRDYLAIEEVRFGDRLQVVWSVDQALARAAVPPLILQPLVENAFRHAIARRTGRRRLEIGAATSDDRLRLWVRDDGPGLPPSQAGAHTRGVGLANTRERLRCLFGDRASLDLASAPGGGVIAIVELPMTQYV